MTHPETFPIMASWDRLPRDGGPITGPRSIPWSVIAPFEDQAQRNHGQTLVRLAQRGGLSPQEAIYVLTGKSLRDYFAGREPWPDEQDSMDQVVAIVESHEADLAAADGCDIFEEGE